MAGRAHGDRRVFVGVKSKYFAIKIVRVIDVRLTCLGTSPQTTESILRRLKRHQSAVFLYARFYFLPGAGTVSRHHELVIAREHQLNRYFGLPGKFAGEHSLNADSKF